MVGSILALDANLAQLRREDLDALASAFATADYPDRHVFIREHARAKALFLVVAGAVSVCRNDHVDQNVLNQMGPGALFGLIALLDGEPASATCVGRGPTTVATLPISAFRLLTNARAPIAYAFQRALGAQLARDFRGIVRALHDRLGG